MESVAEVVDLARFVYLLFAKVSGYVMKGEVILLLKNSPCLDYSFLLKLVI